MGVMGGTRVMAEMPQIEKEIAEKVCFRTETS